MEEFQSVISPTIHITVSEHPDPENRLSIILEVTVCENVVDLKIRILFENLESFI